MVQSLRNVMISVIIPVYNVEKYLRECLDSVLNQTYQDFEILCIDDGSTDGSHAIMEEYAKKHENIKIYQNEKNRGLSYTRNRGMRLAEGKYIFFLDADDFICSDAFEVLITKAEKETPDILFFDYKHLYEEGAIKVEKREQIQYRHTEKIYTGRELFIELVKENQYIVPACFKLYLKEFLFRNELWFLEEILHEDYLFGFQCMMAAKRVSCYAGVLYTYRKQKKGITSQINAKRTQSYFLVFSVILHYWRENIFDESLNEIVQQYVKRMFGCYMGTRKMTGTSDTLPFGTPADKFLYDLFQNMEPRKPEYVYLGEQDWDGIRSAKNIYIYGAGNYGRDLFQKLEKENIWVESFLVSGQPEEYRLCCGKRIVVIDDWQYDTDGLILIAVTSKSRDEIIKKLHEMGYDNYKVILGIPEKEITTGI